MGSISEQEAREAAQRCFDGGFDTSFACAKDYYRSELHAKDNDITSRFVLLELSRRDAERSERDKPIDAEWLESIGFEDDGPWKYFPGVNIHVGTATFSVWCGTQPVSSITTRGQLLDLLKAMKGGATDKH